MTTLRRILSIYDPGEAVPPAHAQVVQFRSPDPRKFKIYRNRKGSIRWYQRYLEAWWIITGKWSLHRAWQDGSDHGTTTEFERTVIMGGR